ncbi:MAG: tetratricopeptide repeat protein [Patescibacteria group bacterium]
MRKKEENLEVEKSDKAFKRAFEEGQPFSLEEFCDILSQAQEDARNKPEEIESIIEAFRARITDQIGPDATAHFDLGIAYNEMGLYDEAITSFERSLSCKYSNPAECLHMISRCLQGQGEFAEAKKVLRETLSYKNLHAHETATLNMELGIVLDKLGDKKGALKCLEIAREITQNLAQNSSIKDHNQERMLNGILSLIVNIKWESLSPWQQKIHIIMDKVLRRRKRFEDLKRA